jgi:Serine dehydrogenase proteinase
MLDLSTLLLILVVLFLVTPMIQRFATNSQRVRAIRRLEQQRGSRVVTLIHRQESISLPVVC